MAIEANKFTEKDELIANFYILRAGLSTIAEETAKIKSAEKELDELKTQNEENNNQIKLAYQNNLHQATFLKKSLDAKLEHALTEKSNFANAISKLELTIHNLKEERKKFQNANPMKYGEFEWRRFFTCAGVMFPILSIGVFLFGNPISLLLEYLGLLDTTNKYPGVFIILFLVFGFVYIPFIYTRISQKIEGKRTIKGKLEYINKELKSTRNTLENYSKQYKQLKEKCNDYNSKISALVFPDDWKNDSGVDIYKEKIDSLESDLNTSIIPICTEKAKATRQALIDQLGHFLTEEDWKNVDLLIFYISTGRADSLKEALLLVDQQQQTNQIVGALNAAAQYISNTIDENSYKLAVLIDSGFNKLCNQLKENQHHTIRAFSQIKESVQGIGEKVNYELKAIGNTIESQGEAILDAERLNAALLRQANQSSEDLMYELRYNQRYWNK